MKNIIRITGITLLIAALAVPAFAQGRARDRVLSQKNVDAVKERLASLTPEQQEKLEALKELGEKFRGETADSRNEMAKRQIDLRAVLESDDPSVADAKAIQKDSSKLQAKIDQARVEFIIEAKKISPERPFRGAFGMGRDLRGMGGGMGFRGAAPVM